MDGYLSFMVYGFLMISRVKDIPRKSYKLNFTMISKSGCFNHIITSSNIIPSINVIPSNNNDKFS